MSESDQGRLAGRIALITGASRGLGAAVAKRFAAEGAKLVLLARTVGALEELDHAVRDAGGLPPLLVPHDLRDFDGLDRLGASLHERFGHLDVLVGNAGQLGILAPVGHIKPEIWADVIAVNLTANYRLLRSLDPLLRLSEAGRAIFVTDRTARHPEAYWSAYGAAKAALENLVKSYSAEVAKTRVRANLVAPGPLRTALRRQAFPGENAEKLPFPENITDLFVELATDQCKRNGEVFEAQS
jgi:NAD(P)-dependent dehydrogenase (short-subunit alcohol dehydrogenase family)